MCSVASMREKFPHDDQVAATADETVGVGQVGLADVDLGGGAGGQIEPPQLADVALGDNERLAILGDHDPHRG